MNNPHVSFKSYDSLHRFRVDRLSDVIKRLVKSFVGEPAWFRLTQFRIEFAARNKVEVWDPELGAILRQILPSRGYYVDVGAHDGRSSSNTYGLESQGWEGILVEPILSKYFRIRQLRSLTANRVFHAACVPNSFPAESVSMIYADLMSFSEDLSVVDRETWIEGSREFLNYQEDIVKTYAPARTLDSILEESAAPKQIDFLSIDVEGAEEGVLDGLNLAAYSFSVICIEAQGVNSIEKLFKSDNYKLYATVRNNFIFEYKRQN